MGKAQETITDDLQSFIDRQRMFFVATAPLSAEGHVNVSPKGLDSFRVLSDKRVAYLDLVGSGIETAAHVQENGRLTIMFCAFEGKPLILRLYGRGRCVRPNDPEWPELSQQFELLPGTRQIILLDVERVSTSCGFGVPLYDYAGERDELTRWVAKQGPEGLERYQQKHNGASIDGLPARL